MSVSELDEKVVQRVCDAMQAGAEGEEDMMNLFAEDGVLVEPFNGVPQTHTGKPAIRARYKEMVSMPRPPGFLLRVNSISREGSSVFADWTCSADVFASPMAGRDEYVLDGGKIKKLQINITRPPA